MSELTEEQFNELPEAAQTLFKQDEDGGYSHSGFLKVKSTANELDGKLKSTSSELDTIKSSQAELIEKAKQEAFDEAYATAVKENDTEALKELHAQQIEDAKQRAIEEGKTIASTEFKTELANKEADKTAMKIANLIASDSNNAEILQGFIRQQVTVDKETGEQVILNADGRASSLSVEAFATEFASQAKFKSLVKTDIVTTGGGNVGGNNGSRTSVGAPKTLAECKGDKKLETAYFNEQIAQRKR